MNIGLFILYLVAALLLFGVMIRTYFEHEKIGRSLMLTYLFASLSILSYTVNFLTDNYVVMSAGISNDIIFQDLMLLALYHYCLDFTRLRNKYLNALEGIFAFMVVVDSVVFIINIFNEIAIRYSVNMIGNSYVLGYEVNSLFIYHTIVSLGLFGTIISVLIVKCIRIPFVYWGRYISVVFGGIAILIFKILFITSIVDIRFDFSILFYALLGVLCYWNTFWFSKKNMLNITHKMIIDHMKVPVVLFDYEGIVADFNVAMSKIFDDLKYDAREQTIDWFIKKKNCPDLRKKETFTWKINDEIYDCRVHYLKSDNNRMLGMILVMQDITELTKAYDDLEKSITFDALTGIYNKYSFYKKNKDSNYNRVVVCNIDNLTYINEKFGQAAGDNILIGLANILIEKTKKTDFVARLDDGDFAILLNGSEIKVIEQMTEIKEIIRNRLSTKNVHVNIEFGICEIADMADLEKCVNLARESMVNKKMLSTTSKRSSLLGSLKQGLNEYDMQTDKQIERERELCEKFADFIGLTDTVKAQLSMLAALHDIGKVAIPNSILMKTSKLDEDERELMKTHTEKGYRIAKAASELEPIAFSILSHHERFDGTGYPNGLMGEDIPLLARMFSIVDAYDAMTHDRPYRKAMSKEDAIEEIIKCKGTQFDPKLADEFIKLIRKRG